MAEQDLAAVARTIIDANQYMTLATADAQGQPWAAPVFYATADYFELADRTRYQRTV
jgi:nitroimidazol reductase NimA-like FMN-containing flavoprotein (pyridoxamine 5'-phosphate oxidase superfamily)